MEWIAETLSLGYSPFSEPFVRFGCTRCSSVQYVRYREVFPPPTVREGCCVAA